MGDRPSLMPSDTPDYMALASAPATHRRTGRRGGGAVSAQDDVLDSVLIAALRQIQRRGDLVEFDYPDSRIPAVFAALRAKNLIARRKKSQKLGLTDAGSEFLRGRS